MMINQVYYSSTNIKINDLSLAQKKWIKIGQIIFGQSQFGRLEIISI